MNDSTAKTPIIIEVDEEYLDGIQWKKVGMTLSKSEAALIAIAIALWVWVLFGANLLPSDIFSDVRCGQLEIDIATRIGSNAKLSTNCYRTGAGEIRIRIPMSLNMNVASVTLPLAHLAPEGVLNGPFLQYGKTVDQAMRSVDILKLDGQELRPAGMVFTGRHYGSGEQAAALTIELPEQTAPVALLSIGITPISGMRILALD